MAVVRMPGMSDAESAVLVIWSTVELAADVAALPGEDGMG